MDLTRRRFLARVAAAGGASLAYEAMTGLGLLAAPAQAPFDLTGRVSGVRVVILGAGLAGMTVVYELGKVGYDCRVLEARARSGGRVFTVRRGTVSEEDGPTNLKDLVHVDEKARRWTVPSLKLECEVARTIRARAWTPR